MDKQRYSNSELTDEEPAGWIVTYADLITLLLVFFVLLYSISALNMQKFKKVMDSIQVSLGENRPAIRLLEIAGGDGILDKQVSLEDITGLRSRKDLMLKELNKFIKEKNLGEHIKLRIFEGKVVIQIRGKVLYTSGFASLRPKARPIMDEITKIVDNYPEYNINIKGFTDDIPISTKQFPSNWELSAIRATTVLRYLIIHGVDPTRLTATGYGQLFPIEPNNSEENRAKNRRVEFVLEKKTE